MMSFLCFDAFSLGNHEFDDGDTNLANFIDRFHNYYDVGACPFAPVLGANVKPAPTSKLVGKIANYTIKEFLDSNGVKQQVGIIGIDVRSKTMGSSQPDKGTEI